MKSTVIKFTVAFSLAISAIFPLFAADWTGEDGNTYTALEYLEGNGNGYVLTDIKPHCTDTVKMRFKTPSSLTKLQALFCARGTGTSKSFVGCMDGGNDKKLRIDRDGTASRSSSKVLVTSTQYLLEADFNDRVVKLNGSAVSFQPDLATGIYDIDSALVLFALCNNSTISTSYKGQHTLYYFELYDSDGNLKNCFLPAVNASGVKGLYDTKTGKFYPQAGTAFESAARVVTGEGKKWTGRGGNNNMSTGANWEGGEVPVAGDDLDFTLAPPLAEINADISDVVFGKLWIDDGDIPTFTGTLTVSACNDRAKVASNPSIVFAAGNYMWNGGANANWSGDKVWTLDNEATDWANGNNAIFATSGDKATLDTDVTANSLAFNANATIDGEKTLTVPNVSVSTDVSATIAAPTAGMLVKTGTGPLTLESSRTDTTVLNEGTLALSGAASLDWSTFTFGDDPAKPVTLNVGESATLANVPSTWEIGYDADITSAIVKAGGCWTNTILRLGGASGATASFFHKGGELTLKGGSSSAGLILGYSAGAGKSYFEIDNSTVICETYPVIGYKSEGELVVKNNGALDSADQVHVGSNVKGFGTLTVVDGGLLKTTRVHFNLSSADSIGVVNLEKGGVITADQFYRTKAGSATVNFDGGKYVKSAVKYADVNVFPANGVNVTVSTNGGTIDNGSNSATIPCTITGDGGITFEGSGTTTISANQEYKGMTKVSEGTTLSVSGGVSFAGDVEFAAGSKLDIANYVGGVNPVTAKSFTFPDSGTVSLTLNSGSFIAGAYAICKASLVSAEQARLSFAPSTGDLRYSWDVSATGDLLLLVGDIHGYSWTGLAGDNKFATGGNWVSGIAPSASGPVDFSAVTSDITVDMDGVTAGTIFGAVTMGTGVITFTGEFSAASFSDTSKIAVGADSTVTLVGDLVFSGNVNEYICNTIAAGGVFCVTGVIEAEKGKTNLLLPSVATSFAGTIRANGLVNNGSGKFWLVRNADNSHGRWEIGAAGISGTGLMGYSSDSGSLTFSATITATADFEVTTPIVNRRTLTLNPAGHVITLGTSTSASAGAIVGSSKASTLIDGPGKVVAKYTIGTYTKTNPFTVKSGATLVLVPGANLGTSVLTVDDGGTLEVAESGTVTLGGGLTVANGAVLGFNFTDRRVAPQIAVAQGKTVTVSGAVKVKVSGDVWPIGGDYVLTACGGFDAEGVSLADGAPKWAKGIGVNEEGNIVLTVRPKPTMIIVR